MFLFASLKKNGLAFYGYPICLMDSQMATACTFLTNGGSLLNSHGLIINKKTIIITYKTTIQLFILSSCARSAIVSVLLWNFKDVGS